MLNLSAKPRNKKAIGIPSILSSVCAIIGVFVHPLYFGAAAIILSVPGWRREAGQKPNDETVATIAFWIGFCELFIGVVSLLLVAAGLGSINLFELLFK